VAETPEKEPKAETPNKETQLDKQPAALNRRSSRMLAIVVSVSALVVIGAAATYALPNFNIALPNFSSSADLFSRAAASAPIPDPAVTAALKDIQSSQQQDSAALQQNGAVLQQNAAMLQQGAATLESLRQNFTAQQTDLKRISNQLSSLMARVDSLQNAVTPLTTSAIPQSKARARVVRTSTKNVSRLPKPIGPVSVRGAPLSPAPAPVFGG
jgi:hypothetical protein